MQDNPVKCREGKPLFRRIHYAKGEMQENSDIYRDRKSLFRRIQYAQVTGKMFSWKSTIAELDINSTGQGNAGAGIALVSNTRPIQARKDLRLRGNNNELGASGHWVLGGLT